MNIPGVKINVPPPAPQRWTHTHGLPVVWCQIAHTSADPNTRRINDTTFGVISTGYDSTQMQGIVDYFVAEGITDIHLNGPYGSLNTGTGVPAEEPVPFQFNQYELAVAAGLTNLTNISKWHTFVDYALSQGCRIFSQIDGYQSVPDKIGVEYDASLRPWLLYNCEHLMYRGSRIMWGAANYFNTSSNIINTGTLKFMNECQAIYQQVQCSEGIPYLDDANLDDWRKFDFAVEYNVFLYRHLQDGTDGTHHFWQADDEAFPEDVNIYIIWTTPLDPADLWSQWQGLEAQVLPRVWEKMVPMVDRSTLVTAFTGGYSNNLNDPAP